MYQNDIIKYLFVYLIFKSGFILSARATENETDENSQFSSSISTTAVTMTTPASSIVVSFQVQNRTLHTFNVTWLPPTNYGGQIINYTVIYCQMSSEGGKIMSCKQMTVNASTTSMVLKDLQEFTTYNVKLQVELKSGQLLNSKDITQLKTHGVPCACDKIGTVDPDHDDCDHKTGKCPCKPLYAGLRCNLCKKGYYRKKDSDECHSCPCVLDHSGTDRSCTVVSGTPECNHCLKGYAKPRCWQCDRDYYYSHNEKKQVICVSCQCNGNGDSTGRMCDQNDGTCNCVNNTTGKNCERCKDGYEGSALAKNCTKINVPNEKTNLAFKQDRTLTTGILIAVGAIAGCLILSLGIFIGRRKYLQWKKKPGQFWTVELTQETEDMTFQMDQEWNECNNTNDATMLISNGSYRGRFSTPSGEEPNPYTPITVS